MAKSKAGKYLARQWEKGGTIPSRRHVHSVASAAKAVPKSERKPVTRKSRNAATKTHTARYPKALRGPGRRGKASGGVKPHKRVNWREV